MTVNVTSVLQTVLLATVILNILDSSIVILDSSVLYWIAVLLYWICKLADTADWICKLINIEDIGYANWLILWIWILQTD